MSLHIAHSHKICNVLSRPKYCAKRVSSADAWKCWDSRAECQRLTANSRSTRRARNNETAQTITQNDQLPLTGGPQMLTTSKLLLVKHWQS